MIITKEGKQMPRTQVLRYAEAMEQKLQANDEEKGTTGWKGCKTEYLLGKLDEEVQELKDITQGIEIFNRAIRIAKGYDEDLTPEHVKAMESIQGNLTKLLGKESADVGNICMMISDVCGALPELEKEHSNELPR
jgi:hypothetical protein